MNKTYPYYPFKREIIATVAKEKLTFQEAEDKVTDTFIENQKQNSFIVKLDPPRETNQAEQQTGVLTESDVALQNTQTHITGATALPETTLYNITPRNGNERTQNKGKTDHR